MALILTLTLTLMLRDNADSSSFVYRWNADRSMNTSLLFALPSGFECVRTRFATATPFDICVWGAGDDGVVSSQLRRTGVWEPEKAAQFARAMALCVADDRPSPVVLDVGANVGVFTLLAAALGASTVFAFEPIPAHVALIAESVRRNRFERAVRLVAAGASDRTARVDILMNLANRGGSSFLPEKLVLENATEVRAVQCNVTTIDSLVHQRVDVMKIDVEGFESCVVEGATRLFARHGVCFVFLEFWLSLRPCARDVIDYLLGLGYEAHASFADFERGGVALTREVIVAMARGSVVSVEPVVELMLWKPGCSRRPASRAPATLPPDLLAHMRAMAHERLVRIEVDDVKHDIVGGRNSDGTFVNKTMSELSLDEVTLLLRFRQDGRKQQANNDLVIDGHMVQPNIVNVG
jgi:FkbM family methyltransferase